MVQNSTATKAPLRDLSQVERQASGERRGLEDPHNINTLLQDILCFFIMLSLSLLIVASIFCVALNLHHTAIQQPRDKPANISWLTPADRTTKQEHDQQGPIWIRFFRYTKHQQDAKLEQVREPEHNLAQGQTQTMKLKEQDRKQPVIGAPTYHYAETEATVKESESEPQTLPEIFKGRRGLMTRFDLN
ncbi:hypothetical protein KR054_000297 [Drosophila jambulina]|nr:hypothetical protein KR054_000297 [Drosophila jambulina]